MVEEKDRELLGEIPGHARTDSITERIARLRREVARGETVYAHEELRKLVRQLEEYEHLLERLQNQ